MTEDIAYTTQQLAELYMCSDRTITRKIKDLDLENRGLADRQILSSSSGGKETLIICQKGAIERYKSLRDKPYGNLQLNKYDAMRAMINDLERQDIRIKRLEHNMDRTEITHVQKGIISTLVNKISSHTGRHYRSVWKQHNHHFRIHSYNWLPYRKFEESVRFLNSMLPEEDHYILKYNDKTIQQQLELKDD